MLADEVNLAEDVDVRQLELEHGTECEEEDADVF
jgi:hypothetical protein